MRIGDRRYARTGIKVKLPEGYIGRILPLVEGIEILTSFIGKEEIYVDLMNKSNGMYEVKKNGPLAKFVIEKRMFVEPQFLEEEKRDDNIMTGSWETHKEIRNFLRFKHQMYEPDDGLIFPGDNHLIFNKIGMFL